MVAKYRIHGTVGKAKVDTLVEANHGADALRFVVSKFMPSEVKDGRMSRLAWWDENVRLDVLQLEPNKEPDIQEEVPATPAAKTAKRKGKKTV